MEKNDIYSELDRHISGVLSQDQRPNILLLLTDQQRWDTIAACGFSHMYTPNLDRLAREGRIYRNAFSPNPICCPARHNLITGLPARWHGIADNEYGARCERSLPTVAEILSDAGYTTRAIGKMHFQPARRHNGFERVESMEEVPDYREDDDYLQFLRENGQGHLQNIHGVRNLLYMSPQQAVVPEELLGSKWVADRTIQFLREHSRKRPFFVFSGFIAPHPPLNIPPSMAELYRGADLPAPLPAGTRLPAVAVENNAWADFPTARAEQRARECYFTQISYVDRQVGRILDALRESGQAENTLVVFASDHGEMLGDLGCYQKFLPYNGASRIPLLVRFPGRIPSGGAREEFADLNDLLPTFLDAAGLEYPGEAELPGESLLAEMPAKDRTRQYVEYSRGSRRWVSLRRDNWEYNYYYGGGFEELFDLTSPEGECRNLLETSPGEYEALRRELRTDLVRYEERYGLEGYVREGDFIQLPEYVPNPRRNSAFPVFPRTENDSEGFDFYGELLRAVRNEPDVELGKLDVESFLQNKNLPRTGLEQFLAAIGWNRENDTHRKKAGD